MVVHPHVVAFDEGADEYERGRPGYPRALLDWMQNRYRLNPENRVLDLGAGTGKLTRLLCESGAKVVAVEPLLQMRRLFSAPPPDVELLDSTAESMPFQDRSFDLVACGQSFRWFANEKALTEIARVLTPGAACLVIFNRDAPTGLLVERFQEMLNLAGEETPEQKPGADWRQVIAASAHFAAEGHVEFPNPFFLEQDGLVARLRSSNQFTRLSLERQSSLIAQFEKEIDRWPLDLSQLTHVVPLRKIQRA